LKITSTRARLLASSMICGVAALALGGQAMAQDDSTTVGELVVTGSRIPQPNLTSVSPVTAVTNAEIKLEGTTRVEDLLNSLPQSFAGQTSEVSNGATGTATVDLRGLGAKRTLVLIDGRRVTPGDPQSPVADLNFIPAALIDRVDVVTGGASAVYGADAVGGVVNFIMMKNFEGVRLEAQVSGYQHGNDNDEAKALNNAKNFPLPNDTVWDGAGIDLTAIIGVNTGDGRGNATVYGTYRKIDPITQDKRDYSSCSFNETGSGFTCGGSGTGSPARLQVFNPSFTDLLADLTIGAGQVRDHAATDVFNFAPYNYYQRPDERYTFGAFAHYEINKAADVYTQLMFMDDRTRAVIAPSGIFGATVAVPCNSPLLTAEQLNAVCTANGYGLDDIATTVLFRRNVEGGGRQDDIRHTDYRILFGVRGDLGRGWNYDIYGQHGAVVFQDVYTNDFSLSRAALALDVVPDANGNAVCRSELPGNTTPLTLQGCVPYDIFGAAGPSQAALNYLQTPGFANGLNTEDVVSAQLTGNLGEYGIKSPMATDGVGLALGAEYRRETLDFNVDIAFSTGDLAGQGGPTTPVEGAFDVMELFGEIRIPLVQDVTFFKDLSFEGGYRYSDYSTGITTSTYKLALNWAPVADVRFRGSYNRAVRAPNIVELFSPSAIGLGLGHDPCAGPVEELEFTAAQCANTGVSAAQYGNIITNPANQYNALLGGNPNLEPEIADTYSVGAVITPSFVPGLSVAVDYFNIKVENTIGSLNPDIVIDNCAISGLASLCSLVSRAPGTGSLFIGGGFVQGQNINIGFVKTSGIDVDANYRLPLTNWGMDGIGGLAISFQGTWLEKIVTDPGTPALDEDGNIVATSYDCAGLFGNANFCGTPNPKWRHRARLSWTTPVEGLGVSVAWRYFSAVKYSKSSSNPYLSGVVFPEEAELGGQSYFDLSASWRLRDSYTVRFGVNNVFDKEPPLVGSTAGGTDVRYNGNTYPGVYDALGRYVFMGITADF
jgi:iron complex outermembrane recepter protein